MILKYLFKHSNLVMILAIPGDICLGWRLQLTDQVIRFIYYKVKKIKPRYCIITVDPAYPKVNSVRTKLTFVK